MAFPDQSASDSATAERRYPVADQHIKDQTAETLAHILDMVRTVRRSGSIPAENFFDLAFIVPVTPEMDEKYKRELIEHQHQLLMKAIGGRQFLDSFLPWQPVQARWEDQEGGVETTFTRLTKDLALVENIHKDQTESIREYRPVFVTGKDRLNAFVKNHLSDADYRVAHVQ